VPVLAVLAPVDPVTYLPTRSAVSLAEVGVLSFTCWAHTYLPLWFATYQPLPIGLSGQYALPGRGLNVPYKVFTESRLYISV
jgi:hypothetical protein